MTDSTGTHKEAGQDNGQQGGGFWKSEDGKDERVSDRRYLGGNSCNHGTYGGGAMTSRGSKGIGGIPSCVKSAAEWARLAEIRKTGSRDDITSGWAKLRA